MAQNGATVTASNASYDAAISPGGSITVDMQGTWSASDATPATFTLNGTPCI